MPDDDTLALVNGVADDGGVLVGFTDGSWHGIVEDETGDARVGDVVRVEPRSYGSDEYQAVTVVKEGGWDYGNPVAVVEQIFDDTMMVRTEEREMTIDRPDVDVDEGSVDHIENSLPPPVEVESAFSMRGQFSK